MSNQDNREIRCYATEVRAIGGSGDADPLRIEGYAASFGIYSRNLGGFREKIAPGTFNRVISERQDVRCLFNHNPSNILGRTSAGTLILAQDAKGLFYRCTLPNTSYARDLHASIQRGDISECSFSFTVAKGGQVWGEDRDATGFFPTRELTDLDIYDVSPVTYPAYESGTNIDARSAVPVPMELRAAIDLKNANIAGIEHRIYGKDKPAPDYVPEGKRPQWIEVWNSVYKKQISDGTAQAEAEKEAFNQANGAAGPNSGKNEAPMKTEKRELQNDAVVAPINATWDQDVKDAFKAAFDAEYGKALQEKKKGDVAYAMAAAAAYKAIDEMLSTGKEGGSKLFGKIIDTDNDEDARARKLLGVEKRDFGTTAYEDVMSLINAALCEKYGRNEQGWQKYCVIKTYGDYIIASAVSDGNGPAKYFKISYKATDDDTDNDVDAIVLGDGEPVELVYVPDEDERKAALSRVEKRNHLSDEEDGAGEDLSDLDLEFDEEDIEDRGEIDPSKLSENHIDAGMCEDPNCVCQNRFGFNTRSKRAWNPADARDVASKIGNHIGKADRHAAIAAGATAEELRTAHTKAAEAHAAAAEAHAGLAGQTKEVADGASNAAQAATDEAVRVSTRSNAAYVDVAKGEAANAGEAVRAAGAKHLENPTDESQKNLEDAHAVHAAKSRAFDTAKDAAEVWNAQLHGLQPEFTAQAVRTAKLTKEVRSITTRTKSVSGKDLPASAFAYVGDKDRTETWKFPIHDAAHARNALARWGQEKGIPEGSKAGVKAKIDAAAKKFGIEVSDGSRSAETPSQRQRREMLADYLTRMGPGADISFLV